MNTKGRSKTTAGKHTRWLLLRSAAGAGMLLSVIAQTGSTADPVVPPGVQAALALRILEYDRALKSWAGTSLTVGIVTKDAGGGDGAEFRQALAGHDVQSLPIKVVEHSYRDAEGANRWAERSGVRLLYVGADLGGDAAPILAAAQARKVPTVTLSRAQFQAGGTLGIVVREGKPHILVNLPAARTAGMDLDPKLLQLSEVVR
jgi:hypothetical protein